MKLKKRFSIFLLVLPSLAQASDPTPLISGFFSVLFLGASIAVLAQSAINPKLGLSLSKALLFMQAIFVVLMYLNWDDFSGWVLIASVVANLIGMIIASKHKKALSNK